VYESLRSDKPAVQLVMSDAIVQLLRNGLCCIKNLGLFETTFLYDSSIPSKYYDLPEPLNQTTPLEVLISVLQLYALISCTRGGIKMMIHSLGKLRRLERLHKFEIDELQRDIEKYKKKTETKDKDAKCVEDATFAYASASIYARSVSLETNKAIRSLLTGFLIFYIGCGFFWLVANSWHITSTDWIGGMHGLIYALAVQEVCLLPLLFYMIVDGRRNLKTAEQLESYVSRTRNLKKIPVTDAGLDEFMVLVEWTPFWAATDVGLFDFVDAVADEKLVASERKQIEAHLRELDSKSAEQVLEVANDMAAAARVIRMEGHVEFLYFVLNLSAFYGYLMGIICFYWQEEASHPTWVRSLLFNMTVDDADWRGNMAGDTAWAIEPMVILASPFFFEKLRPKKSGKKKVKAD
jgi:hypothetical protein